ncbi:hypothetical protein PHLGIDRAFT_131049 [Phlebiopsis gigantea 11061_1 CR5-6]|uniref:F-box only protein 9 n=1 Tax=Phlebiopsis gigantea (strain 11061_1 CR5-6) TaxID=745531 RepID=A0A0C3RZI5_PHLG1|nr:hypothetical protein PHLGIDRAFT_131049 [Phlebiopsis gigantea 11061_1 CR5-6]
MTSFSRRAAQSGDVDKSETTTASNEPTIEADDEADDDDTFAEEDDIDDELSDALTDMKKPRSLHLPEGVLQPNEATAEELARFRAEWKADLDSRLRHTEVPSHSTSQVQQNLGSPSNRKHALTVPGREVKPAVSNTAGDYIVAPRGPGFTEPLPPQHAKALDLYRRAVTHEQRGELDEALRLYRQAFRSYEDVGRLYDRQESHFLRIKLVDPSSGPHPRESQRRSSDMSHVNQDLEKLHAASDFVVGTAVTLPANHGIVTGTLASIVAQWESLVLIFEPEDEKQPVHLQSLPDELLVYILHYLDTSALERFALVNRKARVLALDSTLWRRSVLSIYIPPQMREDDDLADLITQYKGDFRRLYVEHPRVRLDGVYIAVCHYIRDGLSENAWVHVSHLITYHRYLRFYPNGDVLSLLANEEVAPQQVIPMLKPSLRMKGFFLGHWRLEGTTVYITDLMDPSGNTARYCFQMILELRSRPLGRWNRLDFVTYDSVSVSTGEATPLALKNDRPFWFSKVRSYVA